MIQRLVAALGARCFAPPPPTRRTSRASRSPPTASSPRRRPTTRAPAPSTRSPRRAASRPTTRAAAGPGGEIGFTWSFAKNFGVGLAGTLVSRDATATYTAHVPHPLYLNRDRTAEGTVDVEYQETAGHLDFVYIGRSGSLDFSLFAGPSFVSLSADLLIDPTYYDQAVPVRRRSRSRTCRRSRSTTSGIGFNAGASTRLPLLGAFGFGVQGRFTKATMELLPGAAATGGRDRRGRPPDRRRPPLLLLVLSRAACR